MFRVSWTLLFANAEAEACYPSRFPHELLARLLEGGPIVFDLLLGAFGIGAVASATRLPATPSYGAAGPA